MPVPMPKLGQRYGPKHDPRFAMHHRQPRGGKLTREQLRLCRTDPAYEAALRPRVSDPARWAAFLAGRSHYHGMSCRRCKSTRRRVRDACCYDCTLTANRSDWQELRAGIAPSAERSMAGLQALRERQRREASGEYLEDAFGPFVARRYPTGRLAVRADSLHIDTPDLASLPAPRVVHLCRLYPELRDVLAWAGWSVPA